MTRVLLFGAMGVMCKNVANCAKAMDDIEIVAGIDREDHLDDPSIGFPVYDSFDKVTEEFDVIIDFSVAPAIDKLLDYVEKTGAACVQCTTGLSDAQLERVKEISKKAPVLRSANMSIGVNLLLELVKTAAQKLYERGFDIDIVEQHHRRKQDAPSGTAVAIADAVNEALDHKLNYVYDRSDRRQPRPHDEIGISAVRGGTIVGEHEVIFAGEDEVIEFKHTAHSKAVFAKGAVEAAKFLAGKPAGMYDMRDVIAAKN